MEIVAVDHVQLAMPEGREEEARAFYSGLLGFSEVAKPPALAGRGGCWFEGGAARLHLGVEKEFRPARKAHPALLVRGLPALAARLRQAGVEVIDDERLPGYDRVYASDPFGNRLELLEPEVRVLLLPGLGNSEPEHWQSHWEREIPGSERVLQEEWEAPRCADWVARLGEAVASHGGPLVLVGHSTGCALIAQWARAAGPAARGKVRGAFLVAPSDPEGPHYPPEPSGFAPMPLDPLPFPSIVAASSDDPYISAAGAREYAAAWGSRFVLFPGAGHLGSASALGSWTAGRALLASLIAGDG